MLMVSPNLSAVVVVVAFPPAVGRLVVGVFVIATMSPLMELIKSL